MALGRREPSTWLLYHADHGTQNASVGLGNRRAYWGVAGSHGRGSDPFDNAAMEAFLATLKRDARHIRGP